MLRRVRIAVSVLFAVLTVLLLVMWVRSYWQHDIIWVPTPRARPLIVESLNGTLGLSIYVRPTFRNWFRRYLSTNDVVFGYNLPIEEPTLTWYSTRGIAGVIVPYQLPFAVSGILALVPWIRWPRRFRLRTLFILMTLVAVLLAVWFAA